MLHLSLSKVRISTWPSTYLVPEISSFSSALTFVGASSQSMLRRAASALLKTSTELTTLLSVPPTPKPLFSFLLIRPFSLSVCLRKKKKQNSLWLQLSEGQKMDSNIEEVLAPLRQSVKEQVTLTLSTSKNHACLSVRMGNPTMV